MNAEESDRVITSAIDTMSVAEVRKSLAFIRKEWSAHSGVHPFYPSNTLVGSNMTISEFAFRFVMGHHEKRHHKQ